MHYDTPLKHHIIRKEIKQNAITSSSLGCQPAIRRLQTYCSHVNFPGKNSILGHQKEEGEDDCSYLPFSRPARPLSSCTASIASSRSASPVLITFALKLIVSFQCFGYAMSKVWPVTYFSAAGRIISSINFSRNPGLTTRIPLHVIETCWIPRSCLRGSNNRTGICNSF